MDAWPPPHARLASSISVFAHDAWSAKHRDDDRGAFRLRVEGRRFVLHRPADVSEESEGFHKWNRSLWFERD